MFRKNTAGQFIGFQLLLTATGAVATGLSPAVRCCIDGTFAAGGGTVTEDTGTGGYKYAMSQADTNGHDIQFWFSAATAMPVCVNIVTTAADPTDGVRLGLTGLANAIPGAAGGLFIAGTNAATAITTGLTAHIIGTVDTLTTYTGDTPQTGDSFARIGAAGASLTALGDTRIANLDAAISSRLAASGYTAPDNADILLIKAKTDNLPAAPADESLVIAATNSLASSISALPTAVQNADTLLNRDMSTGSDSGSTTIRTVRQALRFLRNKWAISTGTLTVYKEDDASASWTAAVTTDVTALPIISNDPAGP